METSTNEIEDVILDINDDSQSFDNDQVRQKIEQGLY